MGSRRKTERREQQTIRFECLGRSITSRNVQEISTVTRNRLTDFKTDKKKLKNQIQKTCKQIFDGIKKENQT